MYYNVNLMKANTIATLANIAQIIKNGESILHDHSGCLLEAIDELGLELDTKCDVVFHNDHCIITIK
jgi:hypothetical protein